MTDPVSQEISDAMTGLGPSPSLVEVRRATELLSWPALRKLAATELMYRCIRIGREVKPTPTRQPSPLPPPEQKPPPGRKPPPPRRIDPPSRRLR